MEFFLPPSLPNRQMSHSGQSFLKASLSLLLRNSSIIGIKGHLQIQCELSRMMLHSVVLEVDRGPVAAVAGRQDRFRPVVAFFSRNFAMIATLPMNTFGHQNGLGSTRYAV